MGSLTDGLKYAFARCCPAKKNTISPPLPSLCWNLQVRGVLPINVFKCLSANASRSKTNGLFIRRVEWISVPCHNE